MRQPLVLDLETKYTFRQYSDPKKLGISVVGVYDYKNEELKSFFEDALPKLYPLLENASFIIGFNIDSFDLPVLQAYYPGKVSQFKTIDILEEIKKILGRRLALNDIVKATLGKKKSGHGLQAINYYKEGRLEKLKKYCLDDVVLTKEVFDYGVKNGVIYYPDVSGKVEVKVDWKKYLENDRKRSNISLTLPF
jgi:DEAD/DEAH box helicase domain-containing protein